MIEPVTFGEWVCLGLLAGGAAVGVTLFAVEWAWRLAKERVRR